VDIAEDIAEQIKKDAEAGMPYKELAKKYKLNIKDLSKVIKGEGLKVPPPLGKPTLTEEGLIEYTMALPAQAFWYFDVAKQSGFIKDGNMIFDQWVFECLHRRFTADYGVEIVIQPISTKKANIEAMIKEAVKKQVDEALGKVPEKKEGQ
jgi:hypothetical protein